MNAKCPECNGIAILDEDITLVKCTNCKFEKDYDSYIEIMKEQAVSMASDYIPNRPGL